MREILIVDDVPENLQVLQLILKQPNHRVRAATNATLALKLAKEHSPHLIITDINMPEVSGIELCKQLKADKGLCDIPVIFVSAMTDTDNLVEAFDVGGVDYITKPFKPAEIMARVRTQFSLLDMKSLQLSQALSERIRQMVMGIAHEINTPLGTSITAISHLNDMVATTKEQYQAQRLSANDIETLFSGADDCIELTERNLERVKYCVEALKSISVADTQSVKEAVNLQDVLDGVQVKIKQIKSNVPYELTMSLPDEMVLIDKEKLELALYHLFINSLTHSGVPEISINIVAYCAQNQLHIEFSDNGKGLQGLSVEQLLTPFVTTKRGNSGHMGLGAPITSSIITSGLKGSLSVTSSNRGLQWAFSIPCSATT
ncbi:response regulator [Pseudoalteromonas xiamenensis]